MDCTPFRDGGMMACYSMEEMMAAHEFVASSFEIQVD